MAALDLRGVRVTVVGAGAVALRKLKGLPAGLGGVRVVAPSVAPALRRWARGRPDVELLERRFCPADLKGSRLLFCCADDGEANARAARLGLAAHLWVCETSDPARGNLRVPAVARAGGITLAISTGGASPALAKALRRRFEADLRASDLRWLRDRLKGQRARLKSAPQARRRLAARLSDPETLTLALARRNPRRRRRLEAKFKP